MYYPVIVYNKKYEWICLGGYNSIEYKIFEIYYNNFILFKIKKRKLFKYFEVSGWTPPDIKNEYIIDFIKHYVTTPTLREIRKEKLDKINKVE